MPTQSNIWIALISLNKPMENGRDDSKYNTQQEKTSLPSGTLPAAPFLVTVTEEARVAYSIAFFVSYPSSLEAMKYPIYVSPAAVVSTASTVKAFSKIRFFPFCQ